jgi:hypothetical protein
MNAVIRALTKEVDVLQKEIKKLRFHLMEDNPYHDLLQIHIEFNELTAKHQGKSDSSEFASAIPLLIAREKSARKRIAISRRLLQGDGMDRLSKAELDLYSLSSEIQLRQIRSNYRNTPSDPP